MLEPVTWFLPGGGCRCRISHPRSSEALAKSSRKPAKRPCTSPPSTSADHRTSVRARMSDRAPATVLPGAEERVCLRAATVAAVPAAVTRRRGRRAGPQAEARRLPGERVRPAWRAALKRVWKVLPEISRATVPLSQTKPSRAPETHARGCSESREIARAS